MKAVAPQPAAAAGRTRIIERPDGVYWQDEDGIEYGPFATLTEAMADREAALAAEEEELDGSDSDLDMADWVDSETGEISEGAMPHIEDN